MDSHSSTPAAPSATPPAVQSDPPAPVTPSSSIARVPSCAGCRIPFFFKLGLVALFFVSLAVLCIGLMQLLAPHQLSGGSGSQIPPQVNVAGVGPPHLPSPSVPDGRYVIF